MNKKTKNTFLIDIAVPNTHNIAKTITDKQLLSLLYPLILTIFINWVVLDNIYFAIYIPILLYNNKTRMSHLKIINAHNVFVMLDFFCLPVYLRQKYFAKCGTDSQASWEMF